MVSNMSPIVAAAAVDRIGEIRKRGCADPPMSGASPPVILFRQLQSTNGGIMFKRIVLGLDGSPESTRALELAKQLAAEEPVHIDIVHIREFMIAGRGGVQPTRVDET